MFGAPPNCRPECVIHQDCPSNRACIAQRCEDPCAGSCGFNALCSTLNHKPICSCIEGYEGDPYAGCSMRASKYQLKNIPIALPMLFMLNFKGPVAYVSAALFLYVNVMSFLQFYIFDVASKLSYWCWNVMHAILLYFYFILALNVSISLSFPTISISIFLYFPLLYFSTLKLWWRIFQEILATHHLVAQTPFVKNAMVQALAPACPNILVIPMLTVDRSVCKTLTVPEINPA